MAVTRDGRALLSSSFSRLLAIEKLPFDRMQQAQPQDRRPRKGKKAPPPRLEVESGLKVLEQNIPSSSEELRLEIYPTLKRKNRAQMANGRRTGYLLSMMHATVRQIEQRTPSRCHQRPFPASCTRGANSLVQIRF
eukprot:1006488-Rhodomonas_salina.1